MPRSTNKEIFARYGNVCVLCYQPAAHPHHIIPLGANGPDDDDNIVPLCYNCHTHVHIIGPFLFVDELRIKAAIVQSVFGGI